MADLQAVARRHAQRMIERGEPYHNPDLQSEVSGWAIVGENVGAGPDVDSVHAALMASSSHRRNILSPELTELGVGAARTADGRVWVVQVYRRPQTASPAPPPPTSPPPAPAAPRPAAAVAAPTTAPPSPPPTEAAAPAPTTTVPLERDALPRRVTAAGRSLALADLDASRTTATAPDLAEIAEGVPAPVAAAALLLAGVVGLQGVTLRRLGLVH